MRSFSVTLPFALLLVACGGPSVGDIGATSEVTIAVTGVASAPDMVGLGEPGAGLGVSRLYLSSSALSIMPCAADAGDVTVGARGYDLLGEPAPGERIGTAVTELCAIRLDIDPVTQNALEGIPDGAALYAEGTSTEEAAFSFSTPTSSSVLLEAVDGQPFGDVALLLGLDVSSWLAGVPVDEFASNPDAVQQLVDGRTSSAFALYADGNGNRTLDEDELTPVATARAR